MKKAIPFLLFALACTAEARSVADRVHHMMHNIGHAYDVSRLYFECADFEGPKKPCRPHERPSTCKEEDWGHEKIQELKACHN